MIATQLPHAAAEFGLGCTCVLVFQIPITPPREAGTPLALP